MLTSIGRSASAISDDAARSLPPARSVEENVLVHESHAEFLDRNLAENGHDSA